ncbi:MAG: hypothetical protein GY861_05355 [bacterium]|nr:hypothetical protein [bacterium]
MKTKRDELIEFSKYLCEHFSTLDGKTHVDYVNDYLEINSEPNESEPVTRNEEQKEVCVHPDRGILRVNGRWYCSKCYSYVYR